MIGEVLGNRYELIEKIGEGGMAVVYKARDNKLSRLVAVKILKKEFANNKDIADKFKKEATAIANFSDANIVNVLDVGHEEEGNTDYFVMEYVNGKTLKDLIVENGKLNYITAISIAIQIAKALECAHKNNIIHRDVKPQNILVTENGLVKVTDFGIAKSSTSATITNTTTIMGSAHYLSPEQAKGTFIDLRSDIYSLGIVLYEMVTGILPFDGESPVTIALKHIQSEAIEPKKHNASIPDSLNNLIMKAISKECINRYQNCSELINDLQKIKENPNIIIGARGNYDDGRTIVMEPIRTEEIPINNLNSNNLNNSQNKNIYSKSDFENDYDEEDEDDEDEDDEDDFFKDRNKPKYKKKKKSKAPLIIGIMILLCALLVGVVFGAGLLGGGTVTKEVIIPNIVGMTVEEATKELEKYGLKIKTETVESDKEENTILEMSPKASSKAKKGDTIVATVSGGVKKIKVPDLRDYEINYIQDLLEQKGLEYNVSYQYNDNIKSGYLISQSPERGTEVVKGTTIELVVSKGPEVKLVSVSNYLGRNVDEVKSELEALGLVVSLEEQQTDREGENGLVIKQSIESGIKISVGATIKLTYGKYVATEIDITNYISIGQNLEDAIHTLESEGISWSISGATPDDMSKYTVKGFTHKIKKGESVKIQVEKIKSQDTQTGESGDNTENENGNLDSGNSNDVNNNTQNNNENPNNTTSNNE